MQGYHSTKRKAHKRYLTYNTAMALAQPLLDVFDPSDRFLKRLFAPFSQQTSSDATNLNAAPFNCTQSVILLNYFLLLVPARGIIQYFILYLQSRFLYFQMVNISEKRKSRMTLFQKHITWYETLHCKYILASWQTGFMKQKKGANLFKMTLPCPGKTHPLLLLPSPPLFIYSIT